MVPDYHIHTVFCKHADGHAAEYRETARGLGMPQMCFTDHAPAPDGYDPSVRMQLAEFPAYRDLIAPLQATAGPPEVLFGIEADYYAGARAFLGDWLPRQAFDLVLGSIHYIGDWCFDHPGYAARWKTVDVAGAWREYFALMAELARSRLYDAVGHLDLPKKFGFRPTDQALREMAQPALDVIAAEGMAVEINTSGLRKPVREIYPSPLLLGLAREREIPICFGSDSHSPQEVGADFDKAVQLALDAGYTQCVRFRKREKQLVPLAD